MDFSSAFERMEVSIGSFFCLVPPWVVSPDTSFTEGKGFISDSTLPSIGIVLGGLGSMALLLVRRTVW